ncbi:MAG: hypothetical protein FWC11_02495 [Firmicutes bacterium]|nr:hypothetical protein [Bacillota bacterium]
MKKISKIVFSIIMLFSFTGLVGCHFHGCNLLRPSQPWTESSRKGIGGIHQTQEQERFFNIDGTFSHTVTHYRYVLTWDMNQGPARGVDYFEIRIFTQNENGEWQTFQTAIVRRGEVYRYTFCCGGRSVFYFYVDDLAYYHSFVTIDIRSKSGERAGNWWTEDFERREQNEHVWWQQKR